MRKLRKENALTEDRKKRSNKGEAEEDGTK
jgi:hypothetical protein